MGNPVIVLAERNKELRDRLFCQLLRRGVEVIEASNMSGVFRALRARRDISLIIMSASLDKPGDGVEFARLICRSGVALHVILTSTVQPRDYTSAGCAGAQPAPVEHSRPYDDILASVYQSL